jgi:hypothetical protein
MFKKLLFVSISSVILLSQTLNAHAQPGLNFLSPKQAPAKSSAPIPPSDFASQVKTTNANNHTQFKQQLDQQRDALSRPTIPSVSDVQSMSKTPPPAPTAAEEPETTDNNMSNSQSTKPTKPRDSANTAPSAAETTATPEYSAPVAPAAAPPPSATQNQPYTGFETPSQAPASAGAPQNGGGFSIKY